MFSIRSHHKQAIIKLINLITNSTETQSINTMNHKVFERLAQIISVHESLLNNNNNNLNQFEFSTSEPNLLSELIRQWISSYYNSQDFINDLFADFQNENNEDFDSNDNNNKEEKLWTITLLILNIIYKMRNIFIDLKMMLELGWICLSELDSTLDSLRPNYNKILSVLQKALNEEKRDNKEEIEKCDKLTQEVKQLRNKILDLQRKLIKVNKEKSLLGKNNNSLEFYSMSTHKQTSNATKRSINYSKKSVVGEDSDSEQQTDSTSTSKRKSKVKAYKCEICSKMFATSYKLNRHMYSHTGLRPYSCLWPACHKQFNDNYHLKRHMLTHTGEKPYVCQSFGCTKRFSRPEDLRHHQKSHMRESEESVNDEFNNESSFANDSNDI